MENINENNTVATSNIHPNGAIECYKLFWTNYANFAGRARRSEFWWPTLFNCILAAILRYIPVVGPLFALAVLVPNLAVASRRLHDTGRAFGWFFICLIPVVGTILYIIWQAQDSQPGENRFGANPKNA
ncbi:DUF805 domain-containing protein [uncultured Rikenella sp.]|uniref:DUF805 domain-containing protein n=1 Tax=uncultured Rikenella sp. TaxID=368003 RepID=UPI00261F79C1|nr:DUF805 domain-containing protein [uncultured Rikenella sp.]